MLYVPVDMSYRLSSNSLDDDDEPEWMVEFAKKESRRTIAEKRKEFEARLAKIRQEEERLKQAQESGDRPRKKQVLRSLIDAVGAEKESNLMRR